MLVVLSGLASVLTLVWLVLLFGVRQEDWEQAAINQVLHNLDEIEKLEKKSVRNRDKLASFQGSARKLMQHFFEVDFTKQITRLQKENENLQNGRLRSISVLHMPGYALLHMFPALTQGNVHKELTHDFMELKGRKYAAVRADNLLAKLLSYPLIGTAVSLLMMALFTRVLGMQKGLLIGGLIFVLVLVIVYAQYDEVKDQLNKRRRAISRQFPNVVSKLALLATSGMIVSKAWKETAYSQSEELYLEMQKTAEELDNLVKPELAYTNFINRCSTKETTKLASAIIQNLSKGNAEIGRLLKELAKESWAERQHMARKDGERANSLLIIPTMLLFISILVMIVAPALTNMGF